MIRATGQWVDWTLIRFLRFTIFAAHSDLPESNSRAFPKLLVANVLYWLRLEFSVVCVRKLYPCVLSLTFTLVVRPSYF